MDQALLKRSAERLQELLLHYVRIDHEASDLLGALSELLDKVRGGLITEPMDWRSVPGVYYFTEGHLARYPELHEAYADFKIEITGGETSVLRKLRIHMGEIVS